MPNILITGANRGIGIELARQAKTRGDVIAAVRQSSAELDGLGARVELDVEVTSDDSVAALAKRLEGVPIDVLILNAGVLSPDKLGSIDLSSVRAQLEINALGPLRLAQALSPNLKSGSKIAIITSRMGSIADNTSGGYYGYRMSKAAVNAAGVSLAVDLKPQGVAVAILHPGFVKTDMTGGNGQTSAADSARGLWTRIDELTLANSGSFWHMNGERLPW